MKVETINWIIEQVNDKAIVKTKTTRAKVINAVELISTFSDDNLTMEKKELTKHLNLLDKVCGTYYGIRYSSINSDERYEILDTLAQSRGANRYFDIYSDKDSITNMISHFSHYGIASIQYNYNKIKGVELNDIEKEYISKFYPNMEKWVELLEKITEIKHYFNPTKEEKEARKLKEIKGSVNTELKKAIDEIAEKFRKNIEEKHRENYYKRIDNFIEKYPSGLSINNDRKIKDYASSLFKFIKRDNETDLYIILPNAKEIASKMAKDESDEIIVSWQIKMYNKLGGDFINTFNNNFETFVSGDFNYNDILFKFSDGSSFVLRNNIVSKFSNIGTFFYTFPTTFHDAYLPDGEVVKSPDEYSVKKAFQDFYKETLL